MIEEPILPIKNIKLSHQRLNVLGAALISATLLSGCSALEPYKATTTQGNVITAESIKLLQEGLTKTQVRDLLGPPQGQHPFNPNHWEYLYYATPKNENSEKFKHHLIVKFDQENFVTSWEKVVHNVYIKQNNSWLGLDWF
jgi:outer membrane protein assembly factor BamE